MFEDDLYTIIDVFTKEHSLLYSPELDDEVVEETIFQKCFYASLFSNGECYQVVGSYQTSLLREGDFLFLLSLLTSTPFPSLTKKIITKIIVENYSLFSLIFLVDSTVYGMIASYEKAYSFSTHKAHKDCSSLLDDSDSLFKIGNFDHVDEYQLKHIPAEMEVQFLKEFPDTSSFFEDIRAA